MILIFVCNHQNSVYPKVNSSYPPSHYLTKMNMNIKMKTRKHAKNKYQPTRQPNCYYSIEQYASTKEFGLPVRTKKKKTKAVFAKHHKTDTKKEMNQNSNKYMELLEDNQEEMLYLPTIGTFCSRCC